LARFATVRRVPRRRETLDDLLLANGEGLDAFAKRTGIPRFTLYRLREGKVETPRIDTVVRLAKALGVEPARVRAAIEASRK